MKQPTKVQRVVCPKCGELQLKIYPWSNLRVDNQKIPICRKCQNKLAH